MNHRISLVLSAAAISTLVATAHGDWAANGIPVCAAGGEQMSPHLTSDGAGGAIVIWEDHRSSVNSIYAQRVNASGASRWTNDGVPVSPLPFSQLNARVISDGVGGAIIVWEDVRNGVANKDIYMQRLDASGTRLWTAEGVAVCRASNDQSGPKLVSDAVGGAIIAWTDSRSGSGDIYAQRINASGQPLWNDNGVAVCDVESTQGSVEMIADGSGGALFVWADSRTAAVTSWDIYGQRLGAAGELLWTAGGAAVCTLGGSQTGPKLIADGQGGAFVTWHDDRAGNLDIYAARIDASGTRSWSSEGVPVCTLLGNQFSPELTPDRAGGAIIAWQDARNGGSDIFGQRLDGAGKKLWALDGLAIAMSPDNEALPSLVSRASGETVIAWQAVRPSGETDIYARRVAASGSVDGLNIIDVCTAPRAQGPPHLILDGAGGVIIAWHDARDRNNDIYAQRMEIPTAITLREFAATSSPEGVALSWQLDSETLHDFDWVHVQRAAAAEGPWDDLATLLPSPWTLYVDTTVTPGEHYWYRLLLERPDGMQASVALQVDYSSLGARTLLYPPIETADGIVIRYALAAPGQPRLEILDVRGRRLRILEPGHRPAGEHLAVWDRDNRDGTRAARGVYLVRLQMGSAATARKLVLVH